MTKLHSKPKQSSSDQEDEMDECNISARAGITDDTINAVNSHS